MKLHIKTLEIQKGVLWLRGQNSFTMTQQLKNYIKDHVSILIYKLLLDGFSYLKYFEVADKGPLVFLCYLGDGVFWEVLVGEVTGLDQLAGDRGVWRVRGLPMGACEQSCEIQTTMSHTCQKHTFLSVCAYLTCATLPVFFRWFWSSFVAPSWKVFGRAANSMLNSGVLSWNNEMSTDCAAWNTLKILLTQISTSLFPLL